eukprot:718587-Heterocapsa_arctica.AAC.1
MDVTFTEGMTDTAMVAVFHSTKVRVAHYIRAYPGKSVHLCFRIVGHSIALHGELGANPACRALAKRVIATG